MKTSDKRTANREARNETVRSTPAYQKAEQAAKSAETAWLKAKDTFGSSDDRTKEAYKAYTAAESKRAATSQSVKTTPSTSNYNKGGMVSKNKPMSYNKGGTVKANCGASMKPMQKKSGK